MELRSLRIFQVVAELGSLTRAAEALSMQQSAVSRDMRLLEQRLGTMLFHRHGRGVGLTTEGRAFLEEISPHLAGIDAALKNLQQRRVHGRTVLRVIWTAAVALPIGAHVVQRFHRHFPNIQLKVTSGSSAQILSEVEAGSYDIGVMNSDRPFAGARQQTLMKAPLFFVCRRAVARKGDAASSAPISFLEAASYPLVLWSPQNALRRVVDQHAARNRITLNTFTEIEEYGTIADIISSTEAGVILPKTLMDRRITTGDFLVRPIADPSFRYYYGIVFSNRRGEAIDFISRCIRSELARVAATDPAIGEMVA